MHHHGRSLGQLTNDDALVAEVAHNPAQAPLASRARALVDYAVRLTQSPGSATEEDLAVLRAAGLSDTAIHDTACVVGYYNFVNRVASGLGVQLERPTG